MRDSLCSPREVHREDKKEKKGETQRNRENRGETHRQKHAGTKEREIRGQQLRSIEKVYVVCVFLVYLIFVMFYVGLVYTADSAAEEVISAFG